MDRADMPQALVESLELVDQQRAELWDRGPLLPASSTPSLVLDAARELNEALRRHAGSQSAVYIERWRRRLIDEALAGTLVNPVSSDDLSFNARHLDAVRKPDQDDLISAFETFGGLLRNTDWTTEERRASVARRCVVRKQAFTKQWGLQLTLSDEEWLEL